MSEAKPEYMTGVLLIQTKNITNWKESKCAARVVDLLFQELLKKQTIENCLTKILSENMFACETPSDHQGCRVECLNPVEQLS